MSEEFVEKKSAGKIILIIFIILFILGGIGFGGYFVYKNILNPKSFLLNTSKLLTKKMNSYFEQLDKKHETEDIQYTGKLSFSTDTNEINYLNHLNIDYDIISSFAKEEIQTNIKLNEDEKNILDGNIYIIEDSLYLDSTDLYNSPLLLEKLGGNIFKELKSANDDNISIKDARELLSNYINYLIEAISEGELKSELVDIYKIKYIYEINDNNLNKVQNKYDELIKKDEKIQLLIDEDFLNIKFSPIKIEIIKSLGTNDIYKIAIKSDNENFLLERDEKDSSLYHIKDNDLTGTLEVKNDTWTLRTYENEILTTTVKLTLNDNIVRFSLTQESIDISLTFKEEKKDQVEILMSIKDNTGVSMELVSTVKQINDGFDVSIRLDYKNSDQNLRIDSTTTEKFGNNLLTKKDVSSAVDFNSLNENEQNKFYENLGRKLEGTKLLDLLSNEENSL